VILRDTQAVNKGCGSARMAGKWNSRYMNNDARLILASQLRRRTGVIY
jgi:hypothetical protein